MHRIGGFDASRTASPHRADGSSSAAGTSPSDGISPSDGFGRGDGFGRRDGTAPSGPVTAPGSPSRMRRYLRFGTATRLAAFHALVIATVLGIVVVQFTRAFSNQYRSTITRDLTENVTAFTQGAAARPANQPLLVFARSFLSNRGNIVGDLIIISLPFTPPALGTRGSGALAAVPRVSALLVHAPARSVLAQITLSGEPEQILATPIVEKGHTVGTFVTAGSLTGYEHTRRRVLQLAVGEGIITLLAAIVSVYLLLRRLLGSVYRLTHAARDIGLRGQLDVRLSDKRTGDEVGEMAETFDAMISKIDHAVSVQRRLLADVSHQLRTPLTVMRGHLEVMARGRLDDPVETRATIGVVVDQLDHMRNLVERLLLLGRSLEADFADMAPVDLRATLADVAAAAQVLAPRQWQVGAIPDVVLSADLEKLRGALLNLIDNAVKATGPDDTIRLSATIEGEFVDIMVDDSGPGIPPEEREAVLGRFARPSATDSYGTGLGLAIVEAVARAHGGGTSLRESPLGGCRATIRLHREGGIARPILFERP